MIEVIIKSAIAASEFVYIAKIITGKTAVRKKEHLLSRCVQSRNSETKLRSGSLGINE